MARMSPSASLVSRTFISGSSPLSSLQRCIAGRNAARPVRATPSPAGCSLMHGKGCDSTQATHASECTNQHPPDPPLLPHRRPTSSGSIQKGTAGSWIVIPLRAQVLGPMQSTPASSLSSTVSRAPAPVWWMHTAPRRGSQSDRPASLGHREGEGRGGSNTSANQQSGQPRCTLCKIACESHSTQCSRAHLPARKGRSVSMVFSAAASACGSRRVP